MTDAVSGETAPGLPSSTAPSRKNSGDWIRRIDRSSAIAGLILLAATLAACWPLIREMPDVWFGYETYYAHGVVIPFCTALMIWDRWPVLRDLPLKGSNWALVPLAVLLLLGWPTMRSDMHSLMSILLIGFILCSVWFVAGFKWCRQVSVPITYLLFGLPVFGPLIDRFTQPLQLKSTDMAMSILTVIRLDPIRVTADTIALNNYELNVGVPCSGLKLLLAVMAIVFFFVLIARLRWWANVILVAIVIPLSLVINGMRIAGVGIVGNAYGEAAGHAFHDYSGYISLVLCFGVLYGLTRALGWKS